MRDFIGRIADGLERSGVDPAFTSGVRATITHPRYEAKKLPPTPEAPEKWGVFDTFQQVWVDGEQSPQRAWVERRAEALSHAYQRAI